MNRIGNKKMIFVLLVIAAVGTAFLFLPVRHWFAQVTGLIEGLGPVAPFVFVLGYAVLTLFLIPGSAMTIGAGTVFGLWIGVALVVIGSNLGAFAAFILSRTLMRDRVAEWAAENPKFAALD